MAMRRAVRRGRPRRQVTIAPVAHHESDRRVLDLLGHTQRHAQRTGGRDPAEDALFTRHSTCHVLGVGLADRLGAVDVLRIVDLRHVRFGPLPDTRNARAFFRLCANDLDVSVLLFQKARDTGNRARRTHRRNEMRDAAFGVAPQFGAGGLVMRKRVVRVGKLIEDDALAFLFHRVGQVARVFHAALDGGEDDLSAVSGHALAALHRQVFRHDQHHLVTTHRSGHGQGNAGVARRGFDQRVARLDAAARFGVLDHGQRRAILDRTGRVVAFEFAEDDITAARVAFAGNALELNQRRVADGVFDREIGHDAWGTGI